MQTPMGGAALTKSMIELHGGRVELASSPGSGTTITCYLAVPAQSARATFPPERRSSFGD
jgi:light-regulated signal transduction histidine kinase (bacteriophytochrome)